MYIHMSYTSMPTNLIINLKVGRTNKKFSLWVLNVRNSDKHTRHYKCALCLYCTCMDITCLCVIHASKGGGHENCFLFAWVDQTGTISNSNLAEFHTGIVEARRELSNHTKVGDTLLPHNDDISITSKLTGSLVQKGITQGALLSQQQHWLAQMCNKAHETCTLVC